MIYYNENELYHYGIKGQKWGIRRYQNKDGTLTEAGIKHYGEHGADYLSARKAYRKASRRARVVRNATIAATIATRGRSKTLRNIAQYGGEFGIGMAYANKMLAKNNYTRAKFKRDYETGRRKPLSGKYQPNVEDEIRYGRKESVRIAKRRNKGMSNEKAHKISNAKVVVKALAPVAVSTLLYADSAFNKGRIRKAAVRGGFKAASAIARGIRATKKVHDDYYNTSILDSSGKVVARFHDTVMHGESVFSELLHG